MDLKIKIKYRKNSHEKYVSYIKNIEGYSPFELVLKILKETDVDKLEIKVIKHIV